MSNPAEEEARRNAILTNGQAVDLTTGTIQKTTQAKVQRACRLPDPESVVATIGETVPGATANSSSFAGYLLKNSEAKATARVAIRNMLNAEQSGGEGWRGLFAVPPGSGLEIVLSAFNEETNIPLEIPFFGFLHFVSAVLLDKGVRVVGPIGEMSTEMWTVILAPSGAGKTFATSLIEEAAPVKSNFTEAVSGAAFFEALAAKPWNLWTQDEIAQKLKQIEDPRSPLGEIKEYLLRTYDNNPIERTSKKDGTQRIERPTLGILGLNTQESFKKALSPESLLDGFAQRFGFVWAERDPARPFKEFPIYNRPRILAECHKAFAKIASITIHPRYKIGPEGEEAFRMSFGLLSRGFEQDESYFRRAMFRAFKYAAIYHVILGKETDALDAQDIGWGARAASIHLVDMGKILSRGSDGQPGTSETAKLATKVARVRAFVERRKAEGKEYKARNVVQGLSGIANTQEAQLLLDMI